MSVSICKSLENGYDAIAGLCYAANEGVKTGCAKIGLPPDTVNKAVISFVASCVLAALVSAISVGAFVPMFILTAGVVAAMASTLFAVSVGIIRKAANKTDIKVWQHILLATAVLIGTSFLVATFMPYRVDILITIAYVFASVLVTRLISGDGFQFSSRVPLNKSVIYLI